MELTNRATVISSVFSLWFRDHSRMAVTSAVNQVSPASNLWMIFPKKDFSLMSSSFPYLENNQGTTVKDISNENRVAMITVTQNWAMISDTSPLLMAIGRNTTTITRVMAVTVKPISLAPS